MLLFYIHIKDHIGVCVDSAHDSMPPVVYPDRLENTCEARMCKVALFRQVPYLDIQRSLAVQCSIDLQVL